MRITRGFSAAGHRAVAHSQCEKIRLALSNVEQKVRLPSKFCRHFANAISGLFTTGQSLDDPARFTNFFIYHAGLELHGMVQRFLFHLLVRGCEFFCLKKSPQIDAIFTV